MNTFKTRRTIRKYSDREVSNELLNEILATAMRAPTCGNMQLYSVVVTRSEEGKKALAPAHFNQPMVTQAPVVLTVCADFNRFTRWCSLRNADAGYDNFISLVSAVADASIYAQQIVAIAEEQGLGTCYLGTVAYNAPQVAEVLDLPTLVVPVACITLGWPEGEGEETERLPLEAIVHEEKYREDSDERILELFAEKEAYPANKGYVEENGKENLAQVFTDVRYTRQANEHFSAIALDYLRQTGFLK